jgi:hypothetical protein
VLGNSNGDKEHALAYILADFMRALEYHHRGVVVPGQVCGGKLIKIGAKLVSRPRRLDHRGIDNLLARRQSALGSQRRVEPGEQSSSPRASPCQLLMIHPDCLGVGHRVMQGSPTNRMNDSRCFT